MAQTTEDLVMAALVDDDMPAGWEYKTDDLYNQMTRKEQKLSISAMLGAIDKLETAGRVTTRQDYENGIIKRYVRMSDREIPRRPDDDLLDEAFNSVVDGEL